MIGLEPTGAVEEAATTATDMDPVEQIFLQARAPAGNSNTGFEAYVEGQRGARQNRQLDLQERRLQMDEELHPLEVQAKRMTAQHYLLDTQLKFLQAQRGLAAKAAQGRLLGLALKASQSPDGWTPDLVDEMSQILAGTPEAGADQIGMAVMRSAQAGRMIREQRAFLDSQKDMEISGFTVDPETGRTHVQYKRKPELIENELEVLPIENTTKKVVRVKGAKSFQIVDEAEMDPVDRLNYQQALRDRSAIDRELAEEPPHPTGRDEKGDKVPVISDKRTNLLKQRRAAEERIGAIAVKQAGTATAPVPARASAPSAYPVRPPGLSDDELKQQAAEAIKQGKDPAWVQGALQSWGVK